MVERTPPKRKPEGWRGASITTRRIDPTTSLTGVSGRASARQNAKRHPAPVVPTPRDSEKKPPNRRTK